MLPSLERWATKLVGSPTTRHKINRAPTLTNGITVPKVEVMSNSTQITQCQLANLSAALAFAFKDARGGCYQFDKLPFQTQMVLEDKLARIVRRGTNQLMASASVVVEAWITE